jgi:hypothetical protein
MLWSRQRTERSMSTDVLRACPSCGNEFSGALESCPICMLRKALAGADESGESHGTGEGRIHLFGIMQFAQKSQAFGPKL